MEIKPKAMALPTETDQLEHGKDGSTYPKSPTCHGFTFIAKIIPGCEPALQQYAQNIERAVSCRPNCLAPLKLHSLSWVLFPMNGDSYFMYQCIFDTDFGKYTKKTVDLFVIRSLGTGFENPEGSSNDSRSRRSSRRPRQVTIFQLSESSIPTHYWFSDWIISFQIRRPRAQRSAL